MKHIIITLLAFLPLFVAGQTLSVESFGMDIKDQTANNEATKKIDDNGEVCALIRIETTQKGFSFDGGTIGVVEVDESKVGEIWVYVPAGLARITIRHQQLGTLRDYYFPERLQSARTYVMKLISGNVTQVVQHKKTTEFLVLTFTPKNAMVEIDGVIVEPDDGTYMSALSLGRHEYRISANNYHTEVGAVTIGDKKESVNIDLQPAFGWIEIAGPNGALVYIDGSKVGTAPMKSAPISSGNHDVRVVKDKYLPYREQALVNDNTVTTINPKLTSNFATVTLATGNNGEIWINGEKKGSGRITVDLVPGEYTFETRKASHRSQSVVRQITMETRGTIDLPAPIAITGILSVKVKPVGAKIYIDDKYVGESPLMLDDVLVGEHQVKSVYGGLSDEKRTIEIREGETSEVVVEMSKKREPTKYPGVVIEDGVLKRVPYDFKGEFVIGEEVTRIGDRAFSQCSSMTSVTIPNSVTSIGKSAFDGCFGLTSVTIPNSVTRIEDYTFQSCYGLTSVTIPNSVKSIGSCAFDGCFGLTSVTIPNSVTSIGGMAFHVCRGLTSVTIPNSVTSFGESIFAWCSSLTNMTIPNGVTSIGKYDFTGCSSMTSVIIPNSVTNIGEYAFYNCGLTSVTIPNSVTSIGEKAFYGCDSLTSVTIHNSEIRIGNDAFLCWKLNAIYVPKGSKKHFKKMLHKMLWDKIIEK